MSKYSLPSELRRPGDTPSMEHADHSPKRPFDEERLEELRKRINGDYYSRPDVLQVVAKRLVDDWHTSG